MAIALDPGQVFSYILKEERKLASENQTVFKLRCLSSKESAKIEDSFATKVNLETGDVQVKSGMKTYELLQLGLIGWDNFKGNDGKTVAFDVDDKARLDRLRPAWRRELADAIMEQNILTEKDRKNL